ncbi:MAG: MtrB/PioB family decaheme-associated outer membrane protein [Gallionellaceae bacterium]|nr:MtrB/PioB family decaheme-associated outer membrane protein [Gallionellaceae bacterium]
MSANKIPMQYALLVAALMQILPDAACAAKAGDDADEAKACDDCPNVSGTSGWVEGGIGIQSKDSYHFGRYTGQVDSGAYVNLNGVVSYRGSLDGAYLNGELVDLGLDSRRLSVEGGRQGKYAIGLEYDQVPNYRKQLTGASLETERDRTGVKFSMVPAKGWEITGKYRRETKEGTRDMGAAFGFASPEILAVPVSYQTDDFGVALGYQGERLQARFAYDGSLFNNDRDAVTWNNTGVGPVTGRTAEAPDNQFHQLSAQLGYQLSPLTRLGASFARGRMTQDQGFLPYGTASAAALPASNLNGEVNTTLARLDVNSRPLPRLRLDASYTYSDRDNNTPVNLYNYLVTDSAVAPGARYNRPYSFTQNLLRLKAGYKVGSGTDISAGFDNDKMERTYQQADTTEDRTIWAKLKFQPSAGVDVSLKASHANRDASAYDPTAFQANENPLSKAFEMADRTRNKAGFDVSYEARENLSLGLGLDYYRDNYKNMVLGLTEATGFSASPTLTYTLNERMSASAYYTYERLKSGQTGRDVFDPVPLWLEEDANKTNTVGLNFNWKAIPNKLDVGADLVYAKFIGKMQYPGNTDLPELKSTLTALGMHGTYALKENISLRADYRYERYREDDWANAYDALVQTLGVSPQKQETHLIYLSMRYHFK